MTLHCGEGARDRMQGAGERRAAAERVANGILDARAAGATLTAREMLRNAVAKDPMVLEVMHELEEAVHLVRSPVSGPDMSKAVLDRVHETKPFLTRRTRRKISAARMVLACSVLAGLSAIAILQRLEPGTPTGPVTAAIDASRNDAVHSLRSLASAFDRLADSVEHASAAVDPVMPVRRPLMMGDTTRYEGSLIAEAHVREFPGVRPFGPGPGLFAEMASAPAIMPGIAQPAALIGPPALLLGRGPLANVRPAPPLLSAADKRRLEGESPQHEETPQPPDFKR